MAGLAIVELWTDQKVKDSYNAKFQKKEIWSSYSKERDENN